MKNNFIGKVENCQVCDSAKLEPVLDYGHQAIVQEYLTATELKEPEMTFPLALIRCKQCSLVQLNYVVDPKKVFPKKYPYRTGLTNMLIRNFLELADKLEKQYNLSKKDLIIDIGSNDGTLLKGFRAKGCRVLGIEPTDAAVDANNSGITTIQTYLNKKTVSGVLKKFGAAKIVTATNVFAHINDTSELVNNIKNLMTPDGVFVSESQYLLDMVEKIEFDTVYHEHLRFYCLKPLAYLFKLHGMSIVDAERISAAGGSIRVYAVKGVKPMSQRAKKLLAEEAKAGLHSLAGLKEWAKQIENAKNDLVALILKVKKSGANIVGLGSPARSNTLLGFTKINDHLLDYAGEKNGSPKIGMYTPGTHVLVVDEKRIYQDQPDYCLVLSWHIGAELMKIVRKNGFRGKFIMPLPRPKIIV